MSKKSQGSSGQASGASASPKFYNGPTTSKAAAKGQQAKQTVQNAASKVAAKGQQAGKQVASRSKQVSASKKPSHVLLNTSILLIFLVSFLSFTYCPSPEEIDRSASPSYFRLNNLNPFAKSDVDIPAWERYVCKPTTAYRRHVLEPYVVPYVNDRVAKIEAHPIVKDHLLPAYQNIETRTRKQRQSAARTLNGLNDRFVRPNIPLVMSISESARTHFEAAGTAIWTHGAALAKDMGKFVHPYLEHPNVVKARKAAHDVYNHPVLVQARRQATTAYHHSLPYWTQAGSYSSQKGVEGLQWLKSTGVPRAAEYGVKVLDLTESGLRGLISYLRELFQTHVYPVIKPHYETHVQRHVDTVQKTAYEPVKHHVTRILPLASSLILTPSFDDLRASLKGFYGEVKETVENATTGSNKGKAAAAAGNKKAVPKAERRAANKAVTQSTVASVVGETATKKTKPDTTPKVKVANHKTMNRVGTEPSPAKASVEAGVQDASSSIDIAASTAKTAASSISAQASKSGASVKRQAETVAGNVAKQVQSKASVGTDAAKSVASSVGKQATDSASSIIEQVSPTAASVTQKQAAADEAAISRAAVGDVGAQVVSDISQLAKHALGAGSKTGSVVASAASETVTKLGKQATNAAKTVAAQGSDRVQSAANQAEKVASIASSIGSSQSEQATHQTASIKKSAANVASSVSKAAGDAVQSVRPSSTASASTDKVGADQEQAAGNIKQYIIREPKENAQAEEQVEARAYQVVESY